MKTDNELIAEFMGFTCDNDFGWYEGPRKEGVITAGFGGVFAFNVKDSLFNSSWDWLMPVFDRIELLFFMEKSKVYYRTYITDENVMIRPSNDSKVRWSWGVGTGMSKIEAAHRTVVSFIKDYNSTLL